MFKVEISANSVQELKNHLLNLLEEMSSSSIKGVENEKEGNKETSSKAVKEDSSGKDLSKKESDEVVSKVEKKKKGQKPIAPLLTETTLPPIDLKNEVPLEEIENKIKPAVTITREDALDALRTLSGRTSMDKAKEVLRQFGVSKFSELAEEKYEEFYHVCQSN